MAYRRYSLVLFFRVLILAAAITLLLYGILKPIPYLAIAGGILSAMGFVSLYRQVLRRFNEMDDFFEAVKYRDFSRWFSEQHGSREVRELHKGFNLVNKTFKDMNQEREVQFLYLQKILEMVEVGIIAYNLDSGKVLWVNEYLLQLLDLPSFRKISFVSRRLPEAYEELFETYHPGSVSATLKVRGEELKVLVADTVFQAGEESYKLVVAQNIEETLNQTESEAWKKLLSVMTHEIMNSIAPISSLAETLQVHVRDAQQSPEVRLDLEDLGSGIQSIRKRSEGLLKFAKTYRSLHKVTQLNRSVVASSDLFANIRILMQPSLEQREVKLEFQSPQPELEFEIDTHLIEQVLINLILNGMDACEGRSEARVSVKATKGRGGQKEIRVRDTGRGIPEEIRETVFVPFFSTKKTGSGIGLSLCKQIMTLHGGRVQLLSEEEVGTEMRLVFPN